MTRKRRVVESYADCCDIFAKYASNPGIGSNLASSEGDGTYSGIRYIVPHKTR